MFKNRLLFIVHLYFEKFFKISYTVVYFLN